MKSRESLALRSFVFKSVKWTVRLDLSRPMHPWMLCLNTSHLRGMGPGQGFQYLPGADRIRSHVEDGAGEEQEQSSRLRAPTRSSLGRGRFLLCAPCRTELTRGGRGLSPPRDEGRPSPGGSRTQTGLLRLSGSL